MINVPITKSPITINHRETSYKTMTFSELKTIVNDLSPICSDEDVVIFTSLDPSSIHIDNGVIEFCNNPYGNLGD